MSITLEEGGLLINLNTSTYINAMVHNPTRPITSQKHSFQSSLCLPLDYLNVTPPVLLD